MIWELAKKSIIKQIIGKYYKTSYGENRLAKSKKTCDSCGWEIVKGTYYIDCFIYKNLWYRFHHSTICRAKGSMALCGFYEHSELRHEKISDLIDWFKRIKKDDSWQGIFYEFGFKDSDDIIHQLQRRKDIPIKIGKRLMYN